jgi:PTS system mannose-specific IIA component
MTVGIVLVTHNNIGLELKTTAHSILKQDLSEVDAVSIPAELEPDQLGQYADTVKQAITACDSGSGVLVLTDLHGATPNNLARHFSIELAANVVSGVNLPMLLRALNYPQQALEQLTETALCGGTKGVIKDQP